eukprot:59193-Prymnesium_polylepis.1
MESKRGAPSASATSASAVAWAVEPGIDTVYDGAAAMLSTQELFGTSSSKWASRQTYNSSFRSATPRPWQRKPSRTDIVTMTRGPGVYDPFPPTHFRSSSSTSWNSRGRTGPVGYAFDADRNSLPFRSSIPRHTNSTTNTPK